MKLLAALLLAYVPSAESLLKHAAARAQALGRTREVTLSGALAVGGEPQRDAHLVLRFPLQCRLDGEGGYAVVETDNPLNILDSAAKFGVWFKFEVTPVVDIMDGTPVAAQAIEFRDSIS